MVGSSATNTKLERHRKRTGADVNAEDWRAEENAHHGSMGSVLGDKRESNQHMMDTEMRGFAMMRREMM